MIPVELARAVRTSVEGFGSIDTAWEMTWRAHGFSRAAFRRFCRENGISSGRYIG